MRQKTTKLKKKIASKEVSTCTGYCCGNLQLCDVRKGGLVEIERHYNPSILKKCLQKNRSPEKFKICNFLRTELTPLLSYRTGIGIKISGYL